MLDNIDICTQMQSGDVLGKEQAYHSGPVLISITKMLIKLNYCLRMSFIMLCWPTEARNCDNYDANLRPDKMYTRTIICVIKI